MYLCGACTKTYDAKEANLVEEVKIVHSDHRRRDEGPGKLSHYDD